MGDFAAGFELDNGDGVGTGVGDVGEGAGGIDVDGYGAAMEGDGGCNGVVFRVDYGEGALAGFRAGVDDVDLVAGGAGCDGDGVGADGDFAVEAEIDDVEDGDGVALAVGDVGIFAEVGGVLGELVGLAGGQGEDSEKPDGRKCSSVVSHPFAKEPANGWGTQCSETTRENKTPCACAGHAG